MASMSGTPARQGHQDVFYASCYRQRVKIAATVLDYLNESRQKWCTAREAGGQLFGKVDADIVLVDGVSGPYKGDTRSRYLYRSNPIAAQAAIDEFAERGFNYLGEWHTHPEVVAEASGADRRTIRIIMEQSILRLSSILMLIQGTRARQDGLSVYSCDGSGFTQWAEVATGAEFSRAPETGRD